MNKKFCRVLLMIGLTLVLVGCSKNKLEEPTDQLYLTLEGSFKTLGGIKVDRSITHLFEDEEGEIYYAFSDRYDLDNLDEFADEVSAYGVVLTYPELDKQVFEVRRISEALEEPEEDLEVKMFEYKDADLGFSLQYPDNWEFDALHDIVQLDSPVPEDAEAEFDPDYVLVGRILVDLLKTQSDLPEDRQVEIEQEVRLLYPDLANVSSTLAYVGRDSLFSIHFKLSNGDSYYFVPRESELFEISYHHPNDDSELKTKNAIVFSDIVASFGFSSELEALDEVEPAEVKEEMEALSGDQVEVDEYTQFTSGPFEFSISYPSEWYYSGGNNGYDFSDEPLEDDMVPLIRLDINSGKTEGRTQNGKMVTITVLVDGRSYSLTGSAEYEGIMRTMADSITPTPDEQE